MTGRSFVPYEEAALKARVSRLSGCERVLFAAACAERLIPIDECVVSEADRAESARVRRALDLAWSAGASAQQLEQMRLNVEVLVPDEDDENGSGRVALAQNAVAAVAYALRTIESHDVQDVVWAARQLYDAADCLVLREAPSQTYIDDSGQDASITLVLSGLGSALEDLESASFEACERVPGPRAWPS